MPNEPAVLECQDCGRFLRYLSNAEEQKVAANPYNYIIYCGPCGDVRKRIDRLHDYG